MPLLQMIQLMNEKEALQSQQGLAPRPHPNPAPIPHKSIKPTATTMAKIAKYAQEEVLSHDDIHQMGDAEFIASLHASS